MGGGVAYSQAVGDVAFGVAGGGEFLGFGDEGLAVEGRVVVGPEKVGAFARKFDKAESRKVVRFFEAADDNIVLAKGLGAVSLLHLLDVPHVWRKVAAPDRKAIVDEIAQLLSTGEIIDRKVFGQRAFRRVRQHEDREAVFFL